MKWGGGGGPEGGGPGCCAEVHGVNGVRGGALGIHNTIHNTTQTRHVYGGGGGACWPRTIQSTAIHQGGGPTFSLITTGR
jgi:hypothetical protein